MAVGRLAVAVAFVALAFGCAAMAAEGPVVVFFHQEGCPDCVAMDEVLSALAVDLPEGAVERVEVTTREGATVFRRLRAAYGIDVATVPMLFIGDQVISGSGRAQEFRLRDAIGRCTVSPCSSPLDRIAPQGFPWRDAVEMGLLAALLVLLSWIQLL